MRRHLNEKAGTVIVSVLACVGAVFICTALFSWLQSVFDLPGKAAAAMSGIALCAGCFAGAFTAANMRRRRGAAVGFLFGAAVFAVLLTAGLILVKSFSAEGIAAKAVLIFCSAASGGVIGVNVRPIFR